MMPVSSSYLRASFCGIVYASRTCHEGIQESDFDGQLLASVVHTRRHPVRDWDVGQVPGGPGDELDDIAESPRPCLAESRALCHWDLCRQVGGIGQGSAMVMGTDPEAGVEAQVHT
jgi:hypothetical protein